VLHSLGGEHDREFGRSPQELLDGAGEKLVKYIEKDIPVLVFPDDAASTSGPKGARVARTPPWMQRVVKVGRVGPRGLRLGALQPLNRGRASAATEVFSTLWANSYNTDVAEEFFKRQPRKVIARMLEVRRRSSRASVWGTVGKWCE
jgi:hypothetical protein